MPLQEYAWTLLNTSTPWSTTFTSSGTYARHLVRFSISGVPAASELSVLFDGRDLKWTPESDIGVDRYVRLLALHLSSSVRFPKH
jgi:hypothetical protein